MNSLINRRVFLWLPITKNVIQNKYARNSSVVQHDIPDGFVFVSKNKRFAHSIQYIEVDGCVETREIITWKDPFTNDSERIQQKTMLYITEVQKDT